MLHKRDPAVYVLVDFKCSRKDNQDFQTHIHTPLWVQHTQAISKETII